MDALFWLFRRYERWCPGFIERRIRAAGAAFALEYVRAEDLQTNYVDIGPVNKVRRKILESDHALLPVRLPRLWQAGPNGAS